MSCVQNDLLPCAGCGKCKYPAPILCSWCGNPVEDATEGDRYYELDCGPVCEGCIEACKRYLD